jgi:hypothetical protein
LQLSARQRRAVNTDQDQDAFLPGVEELGFIDRYSPRAYQESKIFCAQQFVVWMMVGGVAKYVFGVFELSVTYLLSSCQAPAL